jgi:hypothetical protein
MASYTDAITQFNPYVSTLPVEAMVKVGMQKQAQYEQGVQKIQQSIDNVAGMDVLKDVDKNYLQTKLNELGNNLKYVAAGDFSNFQLVNSVSGMAKQIGRDQTVQNAVSATAQYRKQVGIMESKRKEGKSDIANEDLFSTQASKWMNDNTAGSSFSAEYVPYTDVFKKLGEIAKNVGEDSTIVQQLFKTDKNGNPLVINGKLQYNDVMAETLLKGKDKDKILNAFQSGLDANDYRQLSITGRYKLKGRGTDELHSMVDEGFNEYQKSALLQKKYLQDKILELKTKNGDQEIINKLKERIVSLDESVNKRKESADELKSSDDDVIRSSIYTNNYLDSISNSMATKETYTKYSKNPAVEVMMDRDKFKLDVRKFQLDQSKFQYQQMHDSEVLSQARWTELFKAGLVDENGKPTGAGLYAGAARDLGINDQTDPTYFENSFLQGMKDDTDTQFKLYEKVAIGYWTNAAAASGDKTPYTKEQTIAGMRTEAKKQGMSYNDYVVLQGQKATEKWNNSKGAFLGAEYSQDFRSINNIGKRLGVSKRKMELEQQYINDNAQGFKPVDFSKVNVSSIDVLLADGQKVNKVTLSKSDMVDVAKYWYNYSDAAIPRFANSDLVKASAESAKNNLIKKYGEVGFNQILRQTRSQVLGGFGGQNMISMITGAAPAKYNPSIQGLMNVMGQQNYAETAKLKEQYYKGISEVGTPKGIPLYKDKPEQMKRLATSLSSIASDYAGIDDEYQTIAKLANDEKAQFQVNVTPAASRYGKNSYELQFTDAQGVVTLKPIKEKDFQLLTGKQASSLFVNEIESAISASPYGSTNLANNYEAEDAYSTAFIKDYETNTKEYNVAADFVKGSGGYFAKLYVQQGNDWKLYPSNVPISEQAAANFASQIDDVFIKSLLKKSNK